MINTELPEASDLAAAYASEKSAELYDFAPSGFFPLSNDGRILELNLRDSVMLGKDRSALITNLFSSFVSGDTLKVFSRFLGNVFSKTGIQRCEVTLSRQGYQPMHVHISGTSFYVTIPGRETV